MNVKTITANETKVIAKGVTDVLKDGRLIKDVPAPSVMVGQQSDLASLPEYPAGTIAYTAGFGSMWQLSASGTWVSI